MERKILTYFNIIILLSVCFAIFWIWWGSSLYNTYLDGYFDIGIETVSMYQKFACNASTQLLALPVFGNHLSPTFLLFVPIFALFQTPITLFVIQAIAMASTAIIVFLIGQDVLKSKKIGFALAFAFLINPGVISIMLFDFHAEAFVPLFFILAFYAYMTNKPKAFFASIILLMFLQDIFTYGIAALLVISLLLYEWHYNSKELDYKKRMRWLMIAFLIVGTGAITNIVVSAYMVKQNQLIPPLAFPPNLRMPYSPEGSLSLVYSFSSIEPINANRIVGTFIVFFGYGITSLGNILISIFMFSPWLKATFTPPGNFALFYTQYYGFVEGASLVSAVLGILILQRKNYKWLNEKFLMKSIIILAIISTYLAFLFTWELIGGEILAIKHGFNPSNYPTAYADLSTAMSLIPRNASVLAQSVIAPHLFYICNLEYPISEVPGIPLKEGLYVKPEYVIMDTHLIDYEANVAGFLNTTVFNVTGYIKGNYTEVYNQSGAMLYKVNP